MAFKKIYPSHGTVIPEAHRPQGSINAALHELPALREHTFVLLGVVLYLPRTKLVVVPHTLRHVNTGQIQPGGAGCIVIEGKGSYPQGCDVDACGWELQRAEQVVLSTNARGANDYWHTRRCASGIYVRTLVEQPVVVEPDPVCVRCGVWLTRPGNGINFTALPTGPECLAVSECADRVGKRGGMYRAPVQP